MLLQERQNFGTVLLKVKTKSKEHTTKLQDRAKIITNDERREFWVFSILEEGFVSIIVVGYRA